MNRRSAEALLVLAVLLLPSACTSAQQNATTPQKTKSAEAQQLYDEIAEMDRRMFDAFNRHDIGGVQALFAEDLEFYHDKGGKLSLEQSTAGLQSSFAQNNGLRRDLVPGSLEVYPIRDYGAIQVGSHRFCHIEDGKNDCGTFKFVHVWQKKEGKWRVTRAVSYDH